MKLLHLLLTCLFLFLHSSVFAQPQLELVAGGGYRDIVHDGSQFLAVGHDGILSTSVDGVEWVPRSPGIEWFAESIIYSEDQYVVVGGFGHVFTSDDAVVWTQQTSGTTQWLFGVTHHAGQYVAVGRQGTVLTSPDALVWTERESGVTDELRGLAAGGGRYVAVGVGGRLISSADGETWLPYDSGTPVALSAVVYDGNRFVVQGPSTQALSADGVNWTIVDVSAGAYGAIAHASAGYVVVGNFGRISFSSDAETWQQLNPSPVANRLTAVTYADGKWVAVGAAGGIASSDDGIVWTARSNAGVDFTFRDMVFGANVFVGVGQSGRIGRSTDGSNWFRQTAPNFSHMNGVAYGDGIFVAVGNGGVIWSSPDGVDWTEEASPVSSQLNGVTFSDDRWQAVGDEGVVISSGDLSTWEIHNVGTDADLSKIQYGGGRFVALGGTLLFTSENGEEWVERTRPGASTLHDIIFVEGQFLIAENNTLLVSDDGITWDSLNAGIASPRALAYGGDTYLAVGFGGSVSYSNNGVNWTALPSDERPTNAGFATVAYGLGRFVATARNQIFATPAITPRTLRLLGFTREQDGSFLLRWEARENADYGVLGGSSLSALTLRPDLEPSVDGSIGEVRIEDDPETLPAYFYQVFEH